jgi:hypothetical protein
MDLRCWAAQRRLTEESRRREASSAGARLCPGLPVEVWGLARLARVGAAAGCPAACFDAQAAGDAQDARAAGAPAAAGLAERKQSRRSPRLRRQDRVLPAEWRKNVSTSYLKDMFFNLISSSFYANSPLLLRYSSAIVF